MDFMVIPLYKIAADNEAEIIWIASEDSMAQRLNCLGFTPGTRVRLVLDSPNDGLKAYLVRNSLIALRDSTTHEILVRQVSS